MNDRYAGAFPGWDRTRFHRLRQEKAAALSAMMDRHRAESGAFRDTYIIQLRELGLKASDINVEVRALIDEANPQSREYDLTGLEDKDEA